MKKLFYKLYYVLLVIFLGVLICEVFGVIKLSSLNFPIWVKIILVVVCLILSIIITIRIFKKEKVDAILDLTFNVIFLGLIKALLMDWINPKPPILLTKLLLGGALIILFLISIFALPSVFKNKN